MSAEKHRGFAFVEFELAEVRGEGGGRAGVMSSSRGVRGWVLLSWQARGSPLSPTAPGFPLG